MLTPELAIRLYRSMRGRRTKVVVLDLMRRLGMRYFVLRMDTTNLCNLRCRMCFYSWERPRRPEFMDIELFDRIARQVLPVTRFLYLSCATEPLMNKNFVSFIETTGRYRVPFTSFCTNGMLLTQEVVDAAIRANLSEIIFSVDGGTKDTYEAIRRGADWERLLDVLGLVAERKNKAGSQKPTIRFNFTCMSRNIVELPAVVRLAGTYHVRSVHVRHLVIPQDPEARTALRDELKYRSAFNSVAKEAKALSQKCGINLVLPESVGAGDVQARRGTKLTKEQNPYCLLPWMQAIIKPNGDVHVCSRFPPMGNVRHESFDRIWGGVVLRAVRRRLLRRSPDACSWHCLHEASTDRGDDQ